MPKRSRKFRILPWVGGLNTSFEDGLIPAQDLTIADNLVFGPKKTKLKREGIDHSWDSASTGSTSIIGLHDFWYGTASTKTQRLVSADDEGNIYQYQSDGTRTDITPAATAEVTDFTFDTKANHTGSEYFTLSNGGHSTPYAVWFDKSGSDPAPTVPGFTLLEVDISGDTTAADVASSVQAIIDAEADFGASVTTDTVTVTNAANGAAPDANAGTISAAAFAINVTTQGSSAKWTSPSTISMETVNNITIICADGSNNEPMYWEGSNSKALPLETHPNYLPGDPSPPSASMVRNHLGRAWMNDKNALDRVHFSDTFNPYKWQGIDDSGALDIAVGDGDPKGITAIFPSFKGDLFVAKRTKLYRVSGFTPESFRIEPVSKSIGCVAHNAVAVVEQDELFWVSDKGIHRMSSNDKYGDFESDYASAKIQTTFNDDFSRSRLVNAWAAYLPTINSVAFAVTLSGESTNNDIYLYNLELDSWYRWLDVPCESFIVAQDTDKPRFYLGGTNSKVSKTFAGTNSDTDADGNSTAIRFNPKSGRIYVDNDPDTIKGFKSFSLVHKPTGNQTVTAKLKIDNLPAQSLAFESQLSTDLLGSSFTLGSSVLGGSFVMAPYTQQIDGYGRGIVVELEQNDKDESVEIQGFQIEWEPAGDEQETKQ